MYLIKGFVFIQDSAPLCENCQKSSQGENRWFVTNIDRPHHPSIVTLSITFFGMKYKKKFIREALQSFQQFRGAKGLHSRNIGQMRKSLEDNQESNKTIYVRLGS